MTSENERVLLLVMKEGRREILPAVRPPTQPGERAVVYHG
jgi:hypothetical protein